MKMNEYETKKEFLPKVNIDKIFNHLPWTMPEAFMFSGEKKFLYIDIMESSQTKREHQGLGSIQENATNGGLTFGG